jgi:uncharacterized protein YcbK (DUF882 family)
MTFTEKIIALADTFPLSVTSWIRSPKRNAQVGGSVNSQHLVGLAVDIIFNDEINIANFELAARDLDLHVLVEDDHLHVQQPRQ